MRLTKKMRQKVWNKSGGKCWYCGEDLPEKGWHADHFKPVIRQSTLVKDTSNSPYNYKFVQTGKVLHPDNETLENIVPSCASCNRFKTTFDIEFFRQEIEAQRERVRASSGGFRIAERLGIIEVKDDPVVFWFEKQNLG